ncbi:MAG: ThuA domain-containing protein [Planctomycetaceae bacterium]|nr:ThuA domain-containing protein [Planctomycetaceae bacterium]
MRRRLFAILGLICVTVPSLSLAAERPHLVIISAEDEYQTETTLPIFAKEHLEKAFRVTFVFGVEDNRNTIPGLDVLKDADAVLVSVRRRVLPAEQLHKIRDFISTGKPVIGIRTASHAFCLRNMEPPEGLTDWPEFDEQVFGGHYTNHHGNKLKSTIRFVAANKDHPILSDIPRDDFVAGGSLYKPSPLEPGATVLLVGQVEGADPEPVAWTFQRADGGQSFYTSLGHVDDFKNPQFQRLLFNGIRWALGTRSDES